MPVHDTDQAGDVVRQFCAAAEDLVIDGGEIVLEADAGADRANGSQDAFYDRIVRVDGRIVADEEGATVEMQTAREAAPADDRD